MHGPPARDGRYLLLLGANMALRERAVVAALRVFDGPVATVSAARPPQGGRYFDHILCGEFTDPGSTLAAVLDFQARSGMTPAAVVPFVDPSLESGHAVAAHFGLPYLTLDTVRCSSVNKDLMKERLASHGIPTPRCLPFRDLAGLRRGIDDLGLPCVIKPSGFGGSMGVTLIASPAQVEDRYNYVERTFKANFEDFSIRNHGFQAEAYCDLPYEVSVEVLNHGEDRRVLAVTDKALGPKPYFAEMGHRVPSIHSENPRVAEMALRACEALGIDHGLAHAEIKLGPSGEMQVIEVAARAAGGGILDLVERAYGVAPFELHIRSYLGRLDHLPVPAQPAGLAAIAVLKAPPGRILRIDPLVADDPRIVRYDLLAAPGDDSGEPECYVQREGYLECFWPKAAPLEVPPDEHLHLAAALSERLFSMDTAV